MTATTATPQPTATMLAVAWNEALYAYEDDADYTEPVDTRPQIRCGHCGATHHAVEIVKACYDGAEIHQCGDLVRIAVEDGYRIVECGEDAAYFTEPDGGYRFWCTAGHNYTDAQTRAREGWEYAEDPREAQNLAAAGVQPVARY